MSEATISAEEFIVVGDAQVFKVKEVVHKGNIRRITITNEEEKMIEISLTLGAVRMIL